MGFVNRALGAIVAFALVVVGTLALFEVAAIVVGARPILVPHDRWLAQLSSQIWGERSTRLVCVALIAGGLVILALQLLRQRPAEVTVAAGAPVAARVPRHDLERDVASDLLQVEGVATATVKLRRRGCDVRATVVAGDLTALREELAVDARHALTSRGADAGGSVKVDVRRQPAGKS